MDSRFMLHAYTLTGRRAGTGPYCRLLEVRCCPFEHALVLQVTEALLDAADRGNSAVEGAGPQSRLPWAGYREDVSRLPLAVYTNTTDENIRNAAMNLSERLLKAGNYAAHEALADWDRR